jgi:hypothetical protein
MHGRHHKSSHPKSKHESETKTEYETENEIIFKPEILVASKAWKEKLKET